MDSLKSSPGLYGKQFQGKSWTTIYTKTFSSCGAQKCFAVLLTRSTKTPCLCHTPSSLLFPPPNALKVPLLPANLNANARRLCSNSDAVERTLQKEAFGKEEIIFRGMHCLPLIIFFFSHLNLMSFFFYSGAVVEIINSGLSGKKKKKTLGWSRLHWSFDKWNRCSAFHKLSLCLFVLLLRLSLSLSLSPSSSSPHFLFSFFSFAV